MPLFLTLLLLLVPSATLASTLRLSTPENGIQVGDTIAVTLELATGAQNINALEGSLRIPPLLALEAVRLDGSLVPLWVQSPAEREEGILSFSGVLPGGFGGTGIVATFVFTAQREGSGVLSLGNDTRLYLHDGTGAEDTLSAPPLSVSVTSATRDVHVAPIAKDTLPPEPFTPVVTSGEPFGVPGAVLIFITQDKHSGVSRYEIARSYSRYEREKRLSWQDATSPYALQESDMAQYLYVRAVDAAGNSRLAMTPPQKISLKGFAANYLLIVVALALIVILLCSKYILSRQRNEV